MYYRIWLSEGNEKRADNKSDALRVVRNSMHWDRLYTAEGSEGELYCYPSQSERDADDTGAYAVMIEKITEDK